MCDVIYAYFLLFVPGGFYDRPTRIHICYVGWVIFNTKFYVEFRVRNSLPFPLCICKSNDSNI
jgi:hypothetical protein